MSRRSLFAVSAQFSAAAATVAVITLGPWSVPTLAGQRASADRTPSLSPSDQWDTFRADVTIRRHLLTKGGERTAEAPEVRYRWTRSQRAGGWRSTVDVIGISAPTVRTSKGPVLLNRPLSVVRIEDDEDGTPVRVFDSHGRPVRLPLVEDRRVLGAPVAGSFPVPALPELSHPDGRRRADLGRDWVDAFIAVPGRKAVRREAFKRRFGRRSGRVGDLDRFVSADGDHTLEVLADRTSAVPLEINVARGGTLLAHSTLTYASDSGGTLRRRAVRTEQRVSARSEQRAVAVVELSNIRLERRGGR